MIAEDMRISCAGPAGVEGVGDDQGGVGFYIE